MRPIAGGIPWLPWPVKRWRWLVAPVPAERLAAWRIGVGLVLLLDAMLFYVPVLDRLYGPQSLAEPDVFADRFSAPYWNWSVLRWLSVSWGASACMGIWMAASTLLIFGWRSRLMALLLWALSISLINTNFYIHNSGDRLRTFMLLLLVFAPTDAAWAVRRRPDLEKSPVDVSGWPARLLLIQMALMYFMNGFYKLHGAMWWNGSVMYYIAHDRFWARWSPLPLPFWGYQALTWAALAWEVVFPVWIMLKWTRLPALVIGMIFHLITFFHLDIAAFPLYALCLYLPLAPWERLRLPRFLRAAQG